MKFNKKTREFFREFVHNFRESKDFKDVNYARVLGAIESKLEFIALNIDTDTDFSTLN